MPLVWKSQLIHEICLSTQESEYAALSQALCVVLPICSTLLELVIPVGLNSYTCATVHARVFEDNNGAFLLATTHCIMNCTKYYIVKWHHFWEAVLLGHITIHKLGTEEQCSDYLTKGLVHVPYNCIHKYNQGW